MARTQGDRGRRRDGDGQSRDREESEFTERVRVQATGLDDYLRDQLQMLDLTDRQRLLAEEFIGNVGEDGYLHASLEEIVGGVNKVLEEHRRLLGEMTQHIVKLRAKLNELIAKRGQLETSDERLRRELIDLESGESSSGSSSSEAASASPSWCEKAASRREASWSRRSTSCRDWASRSATTSSTSADRAAGSSTTRT